MSSWSVVGIAVGVAVVVLGLAVIALLSRRQARAGSDRDGVTRGEDRRAALRSGPEDEPAGLVAEEHRAEPTRRQVVQRGMITLFVAALAGIVASAVDYVWPSVTGTTGGRFKVGSPAEVRSRIAAGHGEPVYDLSGRFFLAEYPAVDLPAARRAYQGPQLQALELGLVALSQKCPHLGCTVKWCASSGWFECPCHGSRYNPVGELERGPSPRGLDRHPLRLVDGVVEVDTATTYLGPPPGTVTTDQPAKGPHCY